MPTAARAVGLLTAVLLTAGPTITACSTDGRSAASPGKAPTTTTTSSTTTKSAGTAPGTDAAPTTGPRPVCTPTTELHGGEQSIAVNGSERPYLLEVPPGLDPRVPTPVILNFHGSGSDMVQQAGYSRLPGEATARGYVVVTPQGTGSPRGWDLGGADDALFDGLLEALGTGMCVDASRVYATGISNGSAHSAFLACRRPGRIAAVAMVAATVTDLCPDDARPAAIAFHGTADPVVPYGGGEVRSEGADGLRTPGADDAIAGWAEHNGCASPVERQVAPDVIERAWAGCAAGADVVFYRIEGGGHTWPGPIDVAALGITHLGPTTTSIDATQLILDFFDRSPGLS